MKILFIHQNFPGQFKHLAAVLAADPDNDVLAFTMQKQPVGLWRNVRIHQYSATRSTTPKIHPWVADFETKAVRGEAAFREAVILREQGYYPDVIIAHPGWGESLFLKEVWPNAKLGIYCEFFYHPQGADVGFDPEFPVEDVGDACRLRLKNVNNLLHMDIADAGISPMHWQASTFPHKFREKILVVHDGIDTELVSPNPSVTLSISHPNGTFNLSKSDEVITFVNRNLEPYRGYHIFMRALPKILQERPNAHVMIVGGDNVSYGARSASGDKWRDIFLKEVAPQIGIENMKRVHFMGHLPYDKFIPLLQLSTVHVYLTYPFVLSWSLLEAMSVGCAIIASDTQPLQEAIKHNETGRLVDFFDHARLAKEVCELLADAPERTRLGSNARAFAQSTYDLEKICLPKQLAWVKTLYEMQVNVQNPLVP